jgi:hypothetical protein
MSHRGYREQNAEQSDDQYPAWRVGSFRIVITPNYTDHHSDEAERDRHQVDRMPPPLIEPEL